MVEIPMVEETKSDPRVCYITFPLSRSSRPYICRTSETATVI
jgi:hypothetical protein